MLIAATNQPLEQAIQGKTFREDLYYRLKVLEINLPPLRERDKDPGVLAEHFVRLHARQYNRGEKNLTDAVRLAIAGYNWPSNVRELSNVMERTVLLKVGAQIEPGDLALGPMNAAEEGSATKAGDYRLAIDLSKGIVLDELERTIIETVLVRTGWSRPQAGQLLGLSRETLRFRIEKHNLRAPNPGTDCSSVRNPALLADWQ